MAKSSEVEELAAVGFSLAYARFLALAHDGPAGILSSRAQSGFLGRTPRR